MVRFCITHSGTVPFRFMTSRTTISLMPAGLRYLHPPLTSAPRAIASKFLAPDSKLDSDPSAIHNN